MGHSIQRDEPIKGLFQKLIASFSLPETTPLLSEGTD